MYFFMILTVSADMVCRGTVKTYSRQQSGVDKGYQCDFSYKRIRMDKASSFVEEKITSPINTYEANPPRRDHVSAEEPASSITAPSSPPAVNYALVSSDAPQDEDSDLSSPPSSTTHLPSPVPAQRKPAFSFFKRKRRICDDGSVSEPLSDITPNIRKLPRVTKKAMRQMQLNLGGATRKTCRTCEMEYVPSVREDAIIHSKFCALKVGGVEMGKAFVRDDGVKRIRSNRASGSEREMVVAVDRRVSAMSRNKTKRVLEVVNAELSSAAIEDDQLWAALDPEKKVIETRKSSSEGMDKRGDRFKAFLYLVDDKCIGFCLAEKISNAFQVVDARDEGNTITAAFRSSSISVSTTADVVLLGIARIWTSKAYRGLGLAMDLLDCARGNFFYGVEVPKNLVAFSQPTESGGQLAKRWYEAEKGWHVYQGGD